MDCSAICVVDHELTRKQIYVNLHKRPCGQRAVSPCQTSKQNIKSNHTLWEENRRFTNVLQHPKQICILQPAKKVYLVRCRLCFVEMSFLFLDMDMNCDSCFSFFQYFLPFCLRCVQHINPVNQEALLQALLS